jgi:hypothetical protein
MELFQIPLIAVAFARADEEDQLKDDNQPAGDVCTASADTLIPEI